MNIHLYIVIQKCVLVTTTRNLLLYICLMTVQYVLALTKKINFNKILKSY